MYKRQSYNVVDVHKSGDAIVHVTETAVDAKVGDVALAKLDVPRRRDVEREHSATHLLHEALRRVLGTHVQQAGSLVAPDRLRFDFAHFERVRPDELQAIEDLVNEKIFQSIPVHTEEIAIEKARTIPNVKMFFGDKYGDKVRVVSIDEAFSVEFCGGTHVRNSSEIGLFKILSESSVASGVRRIEAIAGRSLRGYLSDLQTQHHAGHDQIALRDERIRLLEKELASLRTGELKKDVIPGIVAGARDLDAEAPGVRRAEFVAADLLPTAAGERGEGFDGEAGVGVFEVGAGGVFFVVGAAVAMADHGGIDGGWLVLR